MSASARPASVKNVMQELAERDCPREGYTLLDERIRDMRARGAEVPEELVRESRRLLNECQAQSQGR